MPSPSLPPRDENINNNNNNIGSTASEDKKSTNQDDATVSPASRMEMEWCDVRGEGNLLVIISTLRNSLLHNTNIDNDNNLA